MEISELVDLKEAIGILASLQSETIDKLAKDLSALQGEMGAASKDKENPFFGKKYADLESIWDAARELLPKHNLAVVQTMGGTAEKPVVITTLMHSSGQWVRGRHEMKSRKPEDPQVCGSIITYGRRYGMAAILGIVQSDDDGNSATGNKTTDKTPTPTTSSKKSSQPDKSPIKTPQSTKTPSTVAKPLSKARQDQTIAQ